MQGPEGTYPLNLCNAPHAVHAARTLLTHAWLAGLFSCSVRGSASAPPIPRGYPACCARCAPTSGMDSSIGLETPACLTLLPAWHAVCAACRPRALRIYECHVGMSSQEPKVNSYLEFKNDVLPRIR
jgi:hypothetical protein